MKVHINRITTRISGAEIYTIYLLKALKKVSNLQLELSTDNKELYKRIVTLKISAKLIKSGIGEIGTKKHFLNVLIHWSKYIKAYKNIINKNQKIIIFESMTEKLFLTNRLKRMGHKVIWIEHGPLFSTERATIIKLLYKQASKQVDKIIAVSKNTEQDLLASGIENRKVKTIYIGMPKDSMQKNKSINLQIKKNHKVIGFIGSIAKAKGIYQFVDVAETLLKEDKDFTFLVLGEGEELSKMKIYTKKLGIDNSFIFTGFVDSLKYISNIDVLLFPSNHSEGISIALLESLNAGVPVVASNAGGNKEIIIDGVNGYINKSFDKKEYFKLLKKAFKNKKSLSINAKKLMRDRFNSDRMVTEFLQVFKEVMNA